MVSSTGLVNTSSNTLPQGPIRNLNSVTYLLSQKTKWSRDSKRNPPVAKGFSIAVCGFDLFPIGPLREKEDITV